MSFDGSGITVGDMVPPQQAAAVPVPPQQAAAVPKGADGRPVPDGWARGLGERRYEWLVDCYRMRVDDDYTHGGGNLHGAFRRCFRFRFCGVCGGVIF